VKTVDGVVTLTGVLASDIAVKKAVAAAQSVKGVKKVDSTGLKSKD
jgi:hyperosmotically inducible protein